MAGARAKGPSTACLKTLLALGIVALLATGTPARARVALVIGNSSYPASPLDNPRNDALAVARELRAAGFEVELLLDLKRDAMRAAIRNFGERLSRQRQPSVFYYAGHALQLDWRNYLLPTDIAIRRPEDVDAQGIDLGELLGQIGRANNTNGTGTSIVVLDACRDNPFGASGQVARGLTQVDAPAGTLLAYATAPGRVAQDAGSSSNGLYTEHLLREMRVPGARIEEIFKRVRLAVRRASQGHQTPWESTSLEEDFYFHPPAAQGAAKIEGVTAFDVERALWERLGASQQAEDLEAFLREYPLGRFSELAQLRLDAVLAAQRRSRTEALDAAAAGSAITSMREQVAQLRARNVQIEAATRSAEAAVRRAALLERVSNDERIHQLERDIEIAGSAPASGNTTAGPEPGSINAVLAQALAHARTQSHANAYPPARPGEIRQGWQNGDLMVYSETPFTGLLRFPTVVRMRAASVSSTRVFMRSGLILDHFSYPRGVAGGTSMASTDMQMLIRDYQVGKKWTTRFVTGGQAGEFWTDGQGHVTGIETLDTGAGRFETYRVEIRASESGVRNYRHLQTWWIDVVSRKPIAYERRELDGDGRLRDHRKGVLMAFENDGRIDRD